MSAFFNFFATILAFLYNLIPNYAVAIILLTLIVMIIVTPLTLKGTRSMMVMQQLQPEMRKIQTQYKDDRQRLNEELLKFYKENNINPLGGCLPLLVQMPVFFILYEMLRGLTRRASDVGFTTGWASTQFAHAVNLTKAPPFDRVFDPAYLNTNSTIYKDLSQTFQMKAFGMDLSESASQALKQGFVHALPFLVLIGIVAVTSIMQQRQIQGRNPTAQSNPQQQMIMKIMPIFLPVISIVLPAGLVLYFAVSNIYRIGQQAFISHTIYDTGDQHLSWAELLGLTSASSGDKDKDKKAKDRAKAQRGGGRAGGTKARAKTPAKATAKASSKPAPKASAKPAPSKGGSGTKPSGGRSGGTGSRSSSGRGSGRSAPSKPSGSGSGEGGTPPTLQPRARKNPKKG